MGNITMSADKDLRMNAPSDDNGGQSGKSDERADAQTDSPKEQNDKPTISSESETAAAADDNIVSSETNIKTVLQTSNNLDGDTDSRMPIGPARFNGRLLLKAVDSGETYVVENDELQEVLIGRLDRATGFRPTVDLSQLDGRHLGVSRRHATIHEQDTVLVITDHNSMNGTYLNGEKLVPEQRRLLRHGDILRIGKVELRVVFEK